VLLQYLCEQQNDELMVESAGKNFANIIKFHFEDIIKWLFSYVIRQEYTIHDLLSSIPYPLNLSSNNDDESIRSENDLIYNYYL
jgi:hypothetical protein